MDIEMTQYPVINYQQSITRKRSGSFDATITATGTAFDGSDVGEVGYVTFKHSATRQDTDVKHVFTEPEHRGRGIGGTLMNLAENEARRAGSQKLIIPMAAPKAQTLYSRLGYHKVSEKLPTMEKTIAKRSKNTAIK